MDRQEDRANILIADWLTEHHVHAVQTPYPTLHTFSTLPDSSPLFLALLLSSSSSLSFLLM